MSLYLNNDAVLYRLINEYNWYKRIIVAVDFDYTIFDTNDKKIDYSPVINLMKECNELDFDIVVFTANKNHDLVRKHCEEVGITIRGININVLPQFTDSGKIYYNILLDDRAGLSSAFNTLTQLVKKIKEVKGEKHEGNMS